MKRLFQLGMAFALCAGRSVFAQRERETQPTDTSDYGAKFFDQLRSIFGRFRDTDLRRVFERARPIQCSDLVTDKGEWREVAFFNENRKLGDWYRTGIDEVRSDFAVYIFKGVCGGQRASVQAWHFRIAARLGVRSIDPASLYIRIENPAVGSTLTCSKKAVFPARSLPEQEYAKNLS